MVIIGGTTGIDLSTAGTFKKCYAGIVIVGRDRENANLA